MGEGLRWALIELGGFIILIACARLAAIYESSRTGAAKQSELEGLIPQEGDELGSEQGPAGSPIHSTPVSCWPTKVRPAQHTDPESLDE
jgi:hypothetical protein